MATIASLLVNLGVDISDYDKGMDKAGKSADETSKKVSGAFGGIGNAIGVVGAAIAGSAIVGQLSQMANTALETGGRLIDLSNKTGIAVETLSRFDYISTQAGGSSEALAQAATTLGKKIFDIDGPAKGAANALKELGINAKDSNGTLKTSEQLFLEVSDKLATIDDQTRQAAIANELFGKKAQDVLQPIRDLGSGFGEAAAEADRLGTTMTRDQAAAFDSYGDTITKIQTQFQGLATKGLGLIMPLLNDLVTALSKGIEWLVKARDGSAGFQGGLQSMGDVIARVVSMAKPLLSSFGELAVEVFKLGAAAWNTLLKPAFTAIAPLLGSVFASANQIIKALVALIRGDFGEAKDLAIKAFTGLFDGVKAVLLKLGPMALELGGDMVSGLIKGITNGIAGVAAAARNLATSAIASAKAALRIQSPSKEFEELGQYSAEGYAIGINKKDLDPAIEGFVRKFYGSMKVALEAGFTNYEVLKAIWPENFVDQIKSNATPKMQGLGTELGITTGNAFVDTFVEKAASIADKLKGQLPKNYGDMNFAPVGSTGPTSKLKGQLPKNYGDVNFAPVGSTGPTSTAPGLLTSPIGPRATERPIPVSVVDLPDGGAAMLDMSGPDSFSEPDFITSKFQPFIRAVEILTNVIVDLPQSIQRVFPNEAGLVASGVVVEVGTIDLGVKFGDIAGDITEIASKSFGEISGFIEQNSNGATGALANLSKTGVVLESVLGDFVQNIIAINDAANSGKLEFKGQPSNMPSPISATLGRDYLAEVPPAAPSMLESVMPSILGPLAQFASLLDAINPIAALVAGVMKVLQPAIQTLIYPLVRVGSILAQAFMPVLQALFPVFKLLGIAVLAVGIGIGEVWNAIASALNAVLGWLGINLPKLDMKVLYNGMSELINMTWDEADARDKNTKSIERASEAMTNVPDIWKAAYARFNASDSPMASMNSTGGNTANVTIVSNDPETIWQQLEPYLEGQKYRITGNKRLSLLRG